MKTRMTYLVMGLFLFLTSFTNAQYKVGDVAEDFTLTTTSDHPFSLKDIKDAKGYIVIFTCNHCPYAQAYEQRIIDLNNRYEALGYPVVAINPNDPTIQPEDSFEAMKVRYKVKGYNFPYLLDVNQTVYPKFGATKTPHVFVLQKEAKGNVVKYIGAIDNNYEDANDVTERYVENAVDALLANKKVKVTTTAAIGCSIKTNKK